MNWWAVAGVVLVVWCLLAVVVAAWFSLVMRQHRA